MRMPDLFVTRWLAVVILSLAIACSLGVLSSWPPARILPADQTEIKLAVRSSGKLLGECRTRDVTEMESLPSNMRQLTICPREKSALYAALSVNGQLRYEETIVASGLHNDGVLASFTNVSVPVGLVKVRLAIKDDVRREGFTHVFEDDLELSANRIVTLHFTDAGIRVTGI